LNRAADAWETGAEHVVLVTSNPACTAGSSAEQVDEYTHLLTQVAESPVAGSLQSMAGAVISLAAPGHPSNDTGEYQCATSATTHVIMSRFWSLEEAAAYSALPPAAALREGDSRSPARAIVEMLFELEPVQGSETSAAAL
jgi:hypothetical protein